jgi:hypothetical protein
MNPGLKYTLSDRMRTNYVKENYFYPKFKSLNRI